MARGAAALSAALKNLEHACFDIIEFRADYFDQVGNPEYLLTQAAAVRRAFPETPLLFTFRRAEEGCEYPCSKAYYFELLDKAAASGIIDIIDIDIPARTINVRLSEAELAERRREEVARGAEAWQPHRDRTVSKALRAYASMVSSADEGGVRII